MYSISSEDSPRKSMIFEEEEYSPLNIINFMNNIAKIQIDENTSIFLDAKRLNLSLSPIIPLNKMGILLKIHNLQISKEELLKRIINIYNEQKMPIPKKKSENYIKIERATNSKQIKITDEHFIKDCIILSKANIEGTFIIADRISKAIFGETIIYKYETSDENEKKYAIAYLKFKDNVYIESCLFDNDNEAKLDVCKKIISKYLPKKISREIINNINECIIKEDRSKNERKERYEKFLQEAGGDRQLLNNKRKMSQDEFSRRLPYFNVFYKEKFNDENNINLDEDSEINKEFFFIKKKLPINELLLCDLGIVEHHLKDFKYTPFKMFEMLRDSEKKRGVDLKMEYTQINNKNYFVNIEATIYSQKLGFKINGYGATKEEAGNKCSLKMLYILFKNQFKTYFELNDYFKHKNKKYLDIILIDDNSEENKNKEREANRKESNINKIKTEINANEKVKKEEKNEDKNSNILEIVESIPIYFKNSHNLSFENSVVDYNSNLKTDTHESLDNFYSEINSNCNSNKNSNIGGKLFNCNSYNNYDTNTSNTSASNRNIDILSVAKKNKKKKCSKIKNEK